jgi:hypothetical protein
MSETTCLVRLDDLLKLEKSGRNDHQGWSEECCPICRWGAYSEAAAVTSGKIKAHRKGIQHEPDCWLGIAIAEAKAFAP